MNWKDFIGRRLAWVLLFALLAPGVCNGQVRNLRPLVYGGKRYVVLKDLAGMYGLPLMEGKDKSLLIRGQFVSLQFTGDRREATLNGSKTWLHAPVIKVRGQWMLSDADAQCIVDPLVRPSAYLRGRTARTVVLDPGHGGKDPGALAGAIREKDLVLDIALRVRAHLRANGVRVVMTRETDRYWTLEDRPFIAARGAGDAFVSIHLNASATRSVQGVETFVTPVENYPPTAEPKLTGKYPATGNNRFNHSNMVLGHQIQRSLVGITRAEDRGLKRARFHVLKNSAMPAALVECGFLTNPQEAQKLCTPSYRETVAQGIAQGILNYFALVNRAKVELGATPLIQPTMQVAQSPVPPAAATPIPMASRAWGAPGETAARPAGAQAVAHVPTAERQPMIMAAPAAVPMAAPVAAPAPAALGAGGTPRPVAVQPVGRPGGAAPAAVPLQTQPSPIQAPAASPAPAPAPAAPRIPAPPPPPVRQAIAPPPSKLLNPALKTQ
ncbi:MAG: hypothetical protein GX803_08025 [Lentisphaerae bacterium]|jgi:N-acetylmuramoyl-L-alanine amidase|nr:hypothetical protein [Lentisphaerota bacterium]